MRYIYRLTMASVLGMSGVLSSTMPIFAQDTDTPSYIGQQNTADLVEVTPEDDAILDEILSDIRETEAASEGDSPVELDDEDNALVEAAPRLGAQDDVSTGTEAEASFAPDAPVEETITVEELADDVPQGISQDVEISDEGAIDSEPVLEPALAATEQEARDTESVSIELAPLLNTYADPNAINDVDNEADSQFSEAQRALADRLEASKLPDIVKRYYKARDFAPIFAEGAAFSALNAALGEAYTHALPANRYQVVAPPPSNATPYDLARIELSALQQFLDYTQDMQKGVVDPSSVVPLIHRNPKAQPPTRRLELFVTANDKSAYMRSLWPEHKAYEVLQAEFARLTAGSLNVDAPPVSAGETLALGSEGARVIELRQRLLAMGFATVEPNNPVFDEDLYTQVIAFQRDRGISADGIVGKGTLGTLNYGAVNKLRPLAIAMERFRWDNVPLDGRHIFVNIANFLGEIRDDNERSFQTRVVVGATSDDRQTPEFTKDMQYLVFNPYWWVPPSIAVNEYLPRLQSNPGSFSGGSIEVYSRSRGRWIDPSGEDFSSYGEGNFPFTLRQKNGPDNALGKVKFMFPNQWNIYLHDTPAKSLFGHNTRAYSHGCVRVGDPMDLASALLSKQSGDPRGDISRYLAREKETYVDLVTPVPVHLTYFTTWVNNEGQIVHSADVYGRDYPVYIALRDAGVTL